MTQQLNKNTKLSTLIELDKKEPGSITSHWRKFFPTHQNFQQWWIFMTNRDSDKVKDAIDTQDYVEVVAPKTEQPETEDKLEAVKRKLEEIRNKYSKEAIND